MVNDFIITMFCGVVVWGITSEKKKLPNLLLEDYEDGSASRTTSPKTLFTIHNGYHWLLEKQVAGNA